MSENMFTRFDTMHERDRRTDGQTYTIRRFSFADVSLGERLQAGTEDAPVLVRPAPLSRT